MKDFGILNHYVPLLAAVDKSTNNWATPYVDLKDVLDCTFIMSAGVLTGAATTDTLALTVEASSAGASNASEAAIAFNYRTISAVGTDTTGAVTAATVTGITGITMSDDGKSWLISVDPAAVAAGATNGRYCRVVCTKTGTMSAAFWSALAVLKPRHAATTMISASAA
jgi:hypothetical protein